MSSARIAYARREDTTPEGELNALSAVYRFILDSHAKKKAGVNGTGGDAKGPEYDRPATPILPHQ